MNAPPGFSTLLEAPASGKPLVSFARRAVLIPFAMAAGMLTAWASLAPVSGAVVAGARIKVELERKTVQHREGGIVREIKVRNGQRVRAGDVLVVVDDVRSDAELSLLEDQLRGERVRNARVSAETTLARQFNEQQFAGDPRMAEHLARERAQFAAMRRTLDEQLDALIVQVREARAQAAALTSQIESVEDSGRLAAEELKLNEKLVAEGYPAACAPAAAAACRCRQPQPAR
jgi:multidrug efflux pump subunit AcrA (membrane-fusion protein)